MDRVLSTCAVIAAVGAAVEVLRRVVGWMIRTMRRLARLTDDLLGEPPGPGLPAGRPGLMERVAGMDERLSAVEQVVLRELRPNGGGSIKDQIGKVAKATGADKR